MWPRRSHTLVPLTIITSNKNKVKWMKVKQDAFDKIKRIIAHNNELTYLDFNERIKIHTDARKFQLGVVIRQKANPLLSIFNS